MPLFLKSPYFVVNHDFPVWGTQTGQNGSLWWLCGGNLVAAQLGGTKLISLIAEQIPVQWQELVLEEKEEWLGQLTGA